MAQWFMVALVRHPGFESQLADIDPDYIELKKSNKHV